MDNPQLAILFSMLKSFLNFNSNNSKFKNEYIEDKND